MKVSESTGDIAIISDGIDAAKDKNELRFGKRSNKPLSVLSSLPQPKPKTLLSKVMSRFNNDYLIKKVDFIVGDLRINVLSKYHGDDPALTNCPATLHLTLPMNSTIYDLKRRVHGCTKIPVKRIRFIYCGDILTNDSGSVIPLDAFETTQKKSEDDDLFRSRIYLSLISSEEDDSKSIESVSTDEYIRDQRRAIIAIEETEREQNEELQRQRTERAKTMEEMQMAALLRRSKDLQAFNLKDDLHKIQCGEFFEVLYNSGYKDEGSFSCLTDGDLQQHGLWVPKKARFRILALADTIKRRIALYEKPKSNHKAVVEEELLKNKAIHGISIDGIEGTMTKKKDVKAAWDKKIKAEQIKIKVHEDIMKRSVPDIPPPRKHREDVQLLIDNIRRFGEKDEFGAPKSYDLIPTSKFCCEKHKNEVLELRKWYSQMKKLSNITGLKARLAKLDTRSNGFLSRESLRMVAIVMFQKLRYEPPLQQIERILDKSIMSAESLAKERGWYGRSERNSNVSSIPGIKYDNITFAIMLVTMLEEYDVKRYLWEDVIDEKSIVHKSIKYR